MTEKLIGPVLVSLLLVVPSSLLFAEPFEYTQIFRKDAWTVELTHDASDGQLWCSAETENRRSQSFAITVYDTGNIGLFVFDRAWSIEKRPIRFIVDIDYSRWTIDGSGDGVGISFIMNEPEKTVKFLRELMEGSAVAVLNDNERRLAVFSLSGSYAALTELMKCGERISLKDPFLSPTDPFSGSSDPF